MSDKEYPCPNCQTLLQWSNNNEFRPFCSAQCKNKDLVDWANEGHVIEGSSVFDDLMSDDLAQAEQQAGLSDNVYTLK